MTVWAGDIEDVGVLFLPIFASFVCHQIVTLAKKDPAIRRDPSQP
jgi:hypothetical protein